jgi:hypothetical protein
VSEEGEPGTDRAAQQVILPALRKGVQRKVCAPAAIVLDKISTDWMLGPGNHLLTLYTSAAYLKLSVQIYLVFLRKACLKELTCANNDL